MYRPDNPTCQNVSPIYSLTKCKIAAFTHLVYEGIETFDGFIGRENLPNWKSNLLVEKIGTCVVLAHTYTYILCL